MKEICLWFFNSIFCALAYSYIFIIKINRMTTEEKQLLENLKQGDEFFNVTMDRIEKFEYLMLYPFKNPNNVKLDGYHIILSKSLDEPKRVYYKDLLTILSKGVKTYEQAKLLRINLIEEHLTYLKNKNSNNHTS